MDVDGRGSLVRSLPGVEVGGGLISGWFSTWFPVITCPACCCYLCCCVWCWLLLGLGVLAFARRCLVRDPVMAGLLSSLWFSALSGAVGARLAMRRRCVSAEFSVWIVLSRAVRFLVVMGGDGCSPLVSGGSLESLRTVAVRSLWRLAVRCSVRARGNGGGLLASLFVSLYRVRFASRL